MKVSLSIHPSLLVLQTTCRLEKTKNGWHFSLSEEGYSENLRHKSFWLSSPQAKQVEKVIQSTRFPDSGNYKALGLDGTDFGLIVENDEVLEYVWWCELPTELAELDPLFHLLLQLGELSLDDYL